MSRTKEYWLQIESHKWDVTPWGVDRISGSRLDMDVDGNYTPLREQALVIRRYTDNWGEPDDRLLNSWDLMEPDPSDTNGTIPGAVLEAKVGDEIIVHFRNMDMRSGLSEAERTHSLHPHGVQREAIYDGTYPLSFADPRQDGKKGDRVAPGDTFTYRWTCPHRASAGAWIYHDHTQLHHRNVALGAFGILLIRAPGEQQPNFPKRRIRQSGDTPTHFSSIPAPPKRADYLLVFHEFHGIGLCLNGRQLLGNTPTLVAGEETRVTMRVINATSLPLSFHLHGHRWQAGDRWLDVELLGAGGSVTLPMLETSTQNGGDLGEWLIMGRTQSMTVGSLVVTQGGSLLLA